MAARTSAAAIRRSLLYVPSSSQKMITKSLGIKSDNVTYDLEDSVTPSLKANARDMLKTHLSTPSIRPATIGELAVRINAVSSPFALEDLSVIAPTAGVDAIVVPKVDSAADLHFITDVLRHVAPERHATDSKNPIKVLGLIESAKGIMNLNEISKASPYLDGLCFAAEDFALDMEINRSPDLREFLHARSAIVAAARAAELPSIMDLVCTSFKGEEGRQKLEEECDSGKRLGFNGKQCIHPSQVETVMGWFAPSQQEVEWAVRISIADEKAAKSGRGAWTLDGKMIDIPVVGKAHAIVNKAVQCGFDIEALKTTFKDQEPE